MAAQYDEAAKDRNMEFESVSVSAATVLLPVVNHCTSIAYGLVSTPLNCNQLKVLKPGIALAVPDSIT